MRENPFPELPIVEEAPADWPAPSLELTRHFVMLGDTRISYVRGGSGPIVVLLHGLGACSYAWRYTLPVLTQHYTVYAFDLLGCGESDKPHVEYTVERLAATVTEGMETLDLRDVALIGHSLGGGVALQVYTNIPERITRVVLVDSGGMGRQVHWLLRMSTLPGAQGVLGALSHPRFRVAAASRAMEQRRLRRLQVSTEEQQILTVLDRLRDPGARYAFLSILRNVADLGGQRQSALDHLGDIHVPVLLIWGARDRTIPIEHGLHAASIIPSAHLEVLDRCFHRPQIEAPAEFNDLVLRFLHAEEWPPVTASLPQRIRRVMRQERIRRLAPAALAMTVPAGLGLLLGARGRRRVLRYRRPA